MNNTIELNTLHVLNASAGSGKTYSLVKNYIELLLQKNVSYDHFTKIMAMTFTNKAAIEMKERVLLKLEELSFPDWNNQQTNAYFNELVKSTNLNPQEISKKCKLTFLQILHQYEDFHILTIDKFTLRIIRSFAKELNLNSDFEIIVQDTQFFEKVIDLLISRIGLEAHKALTNTIISFFKLTIDDEVKFNLKKDLINFCEILTNEQQITVINEVLEKDWSQQEFQLKIEERKLLVKNLSEIISTIETEYKTYGEQINLIFGKSKTNNAIEKLILSKENAEEFPKSIVNFLEKKDSGAFVPSDQFIQNLLRAQHWFENYHTPFNLVNEEINSFYFFKLLTFIHQTIEDIKTQENLIRLSEFKLMISNLLKHEIAPYIYEKIGTRISNYLLDEFQDTSQLQWYNLFPLLHDSMASGNKNLIVGDAKQSIYRFRNGLAEQFVALPAIYNPDNDQEIALVSAYFKKNGNKTNLLNNFRSAKNIVSFNNQFFEFLAQNEPKFKSDFYEELKQEAQSSKEGYVEIYSDLKKIDDSNEYEDENEVSKIPIAHLEKIELWIKELLKDQFQGSDICILSRDNKQLNIIAQYLIEKQYAVETTDSLSLNNNEKVKLAFLYLKKRFNPKNNNLSKQFIDYYLKLKQPENLHLIDQYYEETTGRNVKINEFKFMLDYFTSEQHFYAPYASIYELMQHFYRMNGWDETKDAYLHAFADFIYEKEVELGPNLKKIIESFETTNVSLKTTANQNSIKIMTVHKSKGLEFPVVIYYAKRKANKDNKKEIFKVDDRFLYSTLSKKKYANLAAVVNHKEKKEQEFYIDELNVHYVAFTRPEIRFYGLLYLQKELHNNLSDCFQLNLEDNLTFHFGEKKSYIPKIKKEENRLSLEGGNDFLWFPNIALKERKLDETKQSLLPEVQFGNQFHLVMSEVNQKKELVGTVEQFITEGLISIDFKEKIIDKANSLFENKAFNELFENSKRIINEQNLIISSEEVLRPDKIILKEDETIIIDFKTGQERSKDYAQMSTYVDQLKKAGYPHVKGYLYYIEDLFLTQVKDQ